MCCVIVCLVNSIGKMLNTRPRNITLGVREFLGRMVQKIMDNSSRFEQEQIGFVKFWKFIPVFAHEKKRD